MAAAPLDWRARPGYRAASVSVPPGTAAGFSRMAPPETGITFSNRLADATVAQNRLLELGSGVALEDVDGDGLVDVYFCRLEGGHYR